MRIVPRSRSYWRRRRETRVDLPAPLWPTRPTFSPPSMARSKSPPNTGAFRWENDTDWKSIRARLTTSGAAPGRSVISWGWSSSASPSLTWPW